MSMILPAMIITLMDVLKTGMRERPADLSRPSTGSALCLVALPPILSD